MTLSLRILSYLPLVGRSKNAERIFRVGDGAQPRSSTRNLLTQISTSPQGGGKIVAVLAAASLAFSLSACGVKSDLVKQDGKPTPKDQRDPSRPPNPIGQ